MKLKGWIFCAIIAIAAASICVLEYAGGRSGMPLSLGMFPAQVVPILVGLLCVGTLFVFATISFFRRQAFRLNLYWFLLSLAVFAGGLEGAIFLNGNLFRAGFRYRVLSAVSPEELRQIARVSQETLLPDKLLPGSEKWSIWSESEHREKWSALTNSTALGKLDPWVVIINHTQTVELSWGGALVGHWGVIIQTNGKIEGGDIADDIKTFVGD